MTDLGLHVDVDFSSMDAFLLSAADHIVEQLGLTLVACATLVATEAQGTTKFRDRDTRLRPSIRAGEPHYDVQGGLGIDILAGSSEVFYGTYLEFGTKYIEPMYFMRDALAKHEQEIGRLLAAAVEKAYRDAGAPVT